MEINELRCESDTAPGTHERKPSKVVPQQPELYSYYVLAVLFVVYLINFADRHLISVLIEPMKHDLNATDTQMGLLMGVCFGISYALMGMPVAVWADRSIRRSILAGGIVTWSLLTAITGLGRNFVDVILTRIGIGISQTTGDSPVHSLISDYFPPSRRATALGIYTSGAQLGGMLCLVVGGWLSDSYGWRMTFIIMAVPGILMAILVRLTIREPVRGRFDNRSAEESTTSFREALRFLLSKRSYLCIVIANSALVTASYGAFSWYPAFLQRIHGMSGTEVGLWLGIAAGCGAMLGTVTLARVADKLGAKDPRWYLWLPGCSSLLAIPISVIFPLLANGDLAVWLLPLWSFLVACIAGPLYATAMALAKPDTRSVAAAIILLLLNLVGIGLGPTLVGAMIDFLSSEGVDSIRYALVIVAPIQLFGAMVCLLGTRWLRDELSVEK